MAITLKTTRLETLEKEIETGIRSVGKALIEIHDSKLYKNHSTFEAYCKDRWGFSDRYARSLIEAEKVKAKIGTIVPVLKLKTSHLTEISKIPEKQQAQITAEVLEACEAENREPTAKDFKAAAKPFTKPKPKPKPVELIYEDVEDEPEPEQSKEYCCPLCKGCGEWTTETEIPPSLEDSEPFMLAWAQWLVYRTEKKKRMTPQTQSLQLQKLNKCGIKKSIAMIQESISNGWTGLFDKEASGQAVSAKMNDQGF